MHIHKAVKFDAKGRTARYRVYPNQLKKAKKSGKIASRRNVKFKTKENKVFVSREDVKCEKMIKQIWAIHATIKLKFIPTKQALSFESL